MNSIDKQAEEAERLHREAYPDLYTDEDKDTPKTEEDKETVEDQGQDTDKDSVKDGQVQPEPKQKLEDQEDYKQKYQVLQGKYNAEVPRLQSELSELKKTVSELQKAKETPAPEVKIPGEDLLDNQKIKFLHDEYPDVYDALLAFNEHTQKMHAPVQDKSLVEKVERLERSAVMTAEEKFAQVLNNEVSDWEQINNHPEFLTWLQGEDEFSGYTRMQLATQAQNNLDGKRVSSFYKAFKKEYGLDKAEDNSGNQNQKKDMSKFVAPKSSKSAAVDTKVEAEIIPRAEITKFYNDVRRGAYEGRDKEMMKREAEIEKAMIEGRIGD